MSCRLIPFILCKIDLQGNCRVPARPFFFLYSFFVINSMILVSESNSNKYFTLSRKRHHA